jgi:peptide/nickel transport system substrate-binding protein
VRLAASHAIDRKALNAAETLSASRLNGGFVPKNLEFGMTIEPHAYDPAKAKKLLAEAGYPNGLDGGDFNSAPPYYSAGEAVAGYMQAVGIRTRQKNMERAAFLSAWSAKTLRGICMCSVGTHGNAATRMEQFVPSDGLNAYGGWPDVDALWKQQAREMDKKKREALLQRIQQIAFERVRFAGLWDYVWPSGVGPRVAEPAFLLIDPYPWSAPYEELRLKK